MAFIKIEKAHLIECRNRVAFTKNAALVIRPITEKNIADGYQFNTTDEIETFRAFLKEGHKGYYAYYNGKCALRTWIFFSENRSLVGKNFIFKLPTQGAFSGWSKTNPEFQRLGIFSSSLQYAINDNRNKTIYGYVESNNIGSLKGTKKAGFETKEKHILILLFGYGMKIKTYQLGKGKCFIPSLGRTIDLQNHG